MLELDLVLVLFLVLGLDLVLVLVLGLDLVLEYVDDAFEGVLEMCVKLKSGDCDVDIRRVF